jgi:hypothetical protein
MLCMFILKNELESSHIRIRCAGVGLLSIAPEIHRADFVCLRKSLGFRVQNSRSVITCLF